MSRLQNFAQPRTGNIDVLAFSIGDCTDCYQEFSMIQRIKLHAPRACLFGVLLAALAGCDGGDDKPRQPQATTFETPALQASNLPQEPVTGTVAAVPGTDNTPPQTSGGEATAIAPQRSEGEAAPIAKAVTRFTEIAPDENGGAGFKSSTAYAYDLGNLVAQMSDDSVAFTSPITIITPIKGWVRYPENTIDPAVAAPDKYPVVIFEHGNHNNADPSYQGYDYLAKDLAEHGYVVLSIDANAINPNDKSSQSRAQLILGTLDRMRQIDGFGQIDLGGNSGKLDPLKGKLDFTRVGIMGHSRGGQAVANTIVFNKTRRGVKDADLKSALLAKPNSYATSYPDLAAAIIPAATGKPATIDDAKFAAAVTKYNIFNAQGSEASSYDFKAAFMLAPTDFAGVTGLDHVPLASLLPSCDGDVSNLQGARAFDHNRFGPLDDTTPRYQILHRGANHNFYNTVWSARDSIQNTCKFTRSYLNAEEQRRGGLFIINSFMRYHVGGEQKFASYWNGLAQLPKPACPFGKASCDERIVLTVQKDAARSKLIQRFDDTGSMTQNKLGGAVTFGSFDKTQRYGMPSGGDTAKWELPLLDGFGDIKSLADHVELAWTKDGPTITNDLAGISAEGFDSLTFRIAVAQPVGQEVLVTLTDGKGKSATVTASEFTDALYNFPRPKGDGRPMVDHPADTPLIGDTFVNVLSMVAIPLKAFDSIDTTNLKELKLAFPKEWGKVAITDIELQNLGRDNPELAPATAATDGSPIEGTFTPTLAGK
ncbi:hypothetical protein [Phyllobacterium pellucidum]|uniref:hypothetical protein n=1 Tax=Phyllobacterium pellucidum TaxID=2740464 RepID=UPI001D13E984|nr:hypothetical protein [Phyllobacterium sp. T1018]UGY10352.1 hypothetical protein LLE51_003965 [Phyllobacterium sp. T1018]